MESEGIEVKALAAVASAADRLAAAVGPSSTPEPSWEDKLTAVAAELHGGSTSIGGDSDGSPPSQSLLSGGLSQLVAALAASPTANQVTFLPLGMGKRVLLNQTIAETVAATPGKHVVLVVDRPAQALAHGEQLRRELGLAVGVFAGAWQRGRAAAAAATENLAMTGWEPGMDPSCTQCALQEVTSSTPFQPSSPAALWL